MAKISTLYRDGWDPWIKKRGIEGKGGLKDIHLNGKNATLFVDLL